jgi:tetratricopeptide (TPR) repeat protein
MLEKYPRHSLTDEIYWNLANIYQKLGDFQTAVNYLAKITADYNEDILADDAHFLMAIIYEEQLDDKEKAKELFQDFLVKYPGSKFVAEARIHFRKLRGDIIN